MDELIKSTSKGLYCPLGDFYIDPFRPVPVAVITHGHGDHARFGHAKYIAENSSIEILKYRLGNDVPLETKKYQEKFKLGKVWISFHPAGHILGSSQIRIEHDSIVNVISGDYKRAEDDSCLSFEPLKCDLFVTESTFALPIYHWESPQKIAQQITQWWQDNAEESRPTLLFCYSLGKAQRLLSLLGQLTDRTIYIHGSIDPINQCYLNQGIELAPTQVVTSMEKGFDFSKELILAPLSAFRSQWMKRFKNVSTGFASGWMAVRGTRRRRGFDRGFVISDHADWSDLLRTIEETEAKKIWVTHGNTETLSRYLIEEKGLHAKPLKGYFQTDEED
jgi:putative mRNA 3-end processing factor